MKNKILFCLLALPVVLQSQTLTYNKITFADVDSFPRYGWVLDSVKWVAHDTVFLAKTKCKHLWVFRGDSVVFGFHSDFLSKVPKLNKPPFWQQDNTYENRSKICRTCLTEVAEHLVKYWYYAPPPKSEFEILKERQKKIIERKR